MFSLYFQPDKLLPKYQTVPLNTRQVTTWQRLKETIGWESESC